MKKIKFTLMLLLTVWTVNAQKAEQIPSFAKDPREMQWYHQQEKAWTQITQQNPSDKNAWYNLFKVTRIMAMQDTSDKRKGDERNESMVDVLERMEKAIPNSYEFNFCKWQLGGNDMKYYPYLEKAIAIDPDRNEHIDYMINIGEMERNMNQRHTYSLKKIAAGEMSSGMMYYNYNVLIGLERNAILLTAGDNDTYPAWALQAKGIRKDIRVLNLYLLHIKEYREKVFAELGVKNITLDEQNEDDFFNKQIIQHLSKNSQQYPVYVALTSAGCEELVNSVQEDLYLTGLAYVYRTAAFDNIAVLKRNMEQLFALDYIDRTFFNEIAPGRMKEINRNYIVPMLKLYQHYSESGDLQRQKWIKEKLIAISKDTDDEESVLKYLD